MSFGSIEIVVQHNNFPSIAAAAAGKIAQCVQKAVRDVEGQAKAKAAVDTGAMKSSIAGVMTGQYSGEVAPHVEYAIYVEFGTRFMAAQPFMRPAADAVRGPFTSCMKSAFEGT
jgi:HK97 gp10 family phage protein